MKLVSESAMHHEDNRYSNIKKLVSSALEVQNINLAKSKAEDAKVLKMVEQVLALVAPQDSKKSLATPKSKAVDIEDKASCVDMIEEDIMTDSQSESFILESKYDEPFESFDEKCDFGEQSIIDLKEDSVDGKYFF